MMKKATFVSNDLHKIKDHISSAAKNIKNRESSASEDVIQEVQKSEQSEKKYSSKHYQKALLQRSDEFTKTRRDVVTRLTQYLSSVPQEIADGEKRLQVLQNSQKHIARLLDEIKIIDETRWDSNDYAAELGTAMRKVEHVRLEFLRMTVKNKSAEIRELGDTTSGNNSLIPELTSLSFWQLFRLGAVFMLPVMIALLVAVIILSLAILISMGA